MNLPTKVNVGDRVYTVDVVETMGRKAQMGCVYYGTAAIQIATKSNVTGQPYEEEEVLNTFWHELTHAILHDMGNSLYKNEEFVTQFANRLTDAITSAKFK